MKHRWYSPKYFPGVECSTCRIIRPRTEISPCLAAKHPSLEINKLYRERRKAASAANESGSTAYRGWADLERIENELRRRDPDGDWVYEGNLLDGLGWRVRRP